MGRAEQKAKDGAMAARLKQLGIERTSQNCPICHHTVSNSNFEGHLLSCKGRH